MEEEAGEELGEVAVVVLKEEDLEEAVLEEAEEEDVVALTEAMTKDPQKVLLWLESSCTLVKMILYVNAPQKKTGCLILMPLFTSKTKSKLEKWMKSLGS